MTNIFIKEDLWFNLSIIYTFFSKFLIPGILIILGFQFFSYSHPVNALLSFITICVLILIYLFSLSVHFLALIFSIIYIGAILILFLFVIMLFKRVYFYSDRLYMSLEWFYFLIICPLYVYKILQNFIIWTSRFQDENKNFYILNNANFEINTKLITKLSLDNYLGAFNSKDNMIPKTLINSNINVFIDDLYVYYSVFFLIGGIILLIAMVGAITLIYLLKNQSLKKS